MNKPTPLPPREPLPTTFGGFLRLARRKLGETWRPANPFRTASGEAVRGRETLAPKPAAGPEASRPAAPHADTGATADGKSF